MRMRAGFTLIEVTVVVAIIGLLSSIIYGSFSGAREQARNKAIQTELKEIQLAMEVYKAQYDRYPSAASGSGCYSSGGGVEMAENSNGTCSNWQYISGIVPEYIGGLPESRDTQNTNCIFEYTVENSGTWYKMTAERCFDGATQASEGIQPDTDFSRCPSSCASCTSGDIATSDVEFYESMAVYSLGGECQ